MRSTLPTSKSSTIKIVIAVAIVAVIGITSYKLYDNYRQNQMIESSAITDVPSAPPITETIDLNDANTTLDETMLDASNNNDLTELDNELDAF